METKCDKISNRRYFKINKNIEDINKLTVNKRRRSKFYSGKWRKEEHDKFLDLYSKYGSNWPKVNILIF